VKKEKLYKRVEVEVDAYEVSLDKIIEHGSVSFDTHPGTCDGDYISSDDGYVEVAAVKYKGKPILPKDLEITFHVRADEQAPPW